MSAQVSASLDDLEKKVLEAHAKLSSASTTVSTEIIRRHADKSVTDVFPLTCTSSDVLLTEMPLKLYFDTVLDELKNYVPTSTGVSRDVELALIDSLIRVCSEMMTLPMTMCHIIEINAKTIHDIPYTLKANFSTQHLITNGHWYPPYFYSRSMFQAPSFVDEREAKFTPEYLRLCETANVVPHHPTLVYAHMDAMCCCVGDALERIQNRCFKPHKRLLKEVRLITENDYDDVHGG